MQRVWGGKSGAKVHFMAELPWAIFLDELIFCKRNTSQVSPITDN